MNEVNKILAVGLRKLRTKNPIAFVLITFSMIFGILALDNLDYINEIAPQASKLVKYLLISLTGFTSSSTWNFLPDDHKDKLGLKDNTEV